MNREVKMFFELAKSNLERDGVLATVVIFHDSKGDKFFPLVLRSVEEKRRIFNELDTAAAATKPEYVVIISEAWHTTMEEKDIPLADAGVQFPNREEAVDVIGFHSNGEQYGISQEFVKKGKRVVWGEMKTLNGTNASLSRLFPRYTAGQRKAI